MSHDTPLPPPSPPFLLARQTLILVVIAALMILTLTSGCMAVVAGAASDRELEICLAEASSDATWLKLRIGLPGRETLQNGILASIRSHL